MHENSRNSQRWNVKTLVFMALFVALDLVVGRLLSIDLGPYRISFGSVVLILSGLWLGPVAGGICGFGADIIGCFMKGYTVNPVITLAAVMWGVIPALMKGLFSSSEKAKNKRIAWLSVSVVLTGALSSLVTTTAGLVLILGYNFYAIMPGRLVQFVIMMPLYCVLTCLLYFSPLTSMIAGNIASTVLKNKTV